MNNNLHRICTFLLVCLPAGLYAETAYVTDKLMAGLHQDNTTDSVIIKVIPTGTSLEILKREADLTQVRDSEGVTGWINNQFLANTPPATALIKQAEDRANNLENELEQLKTKIKSQETTGTTSNTPESSELLEQLKKENTDLRQQSKSSQLQVGELQAKLAELRNQMSQISSDPSMTEKITQLNKEKSELEMQVEKLKTDAPHSNNTSIKQSSWSHLLIGLLITVLTGMIIGAYLLDLYNRRRHGGFRI